MLSCNQERKENNEEVTKSLRIRNVNKEFTVTKFLQFPNAISQSENRTRDFHESFDSTNRLENVRRLHEQWLFPTKQSENCTNISQGAHQQNAPKLSVERYITIKHLSETRIPLAILILKEEGSCSLLIRKNDTEVVEAERDRVSYRQTDLAVFN